MRKPFKEITKITKLKVAGHYYKILYPYTFQDNEDMIGQHNPVTKIIKLSNRYKGEQCPKESIKEAFLHETLHGIDYIYNGNKCDEATIDHFSEGLYQVLTDNPAFTKLFIRRRGK